MIRQNARSLRIRLILIVIAVTAPPILAAILYLGHLAANVSRLAAEHQLASLAENLAVSVEKWDESMVFALENLKNQPDIVSMDPQRQKPILQQMAKVYSRFAYIHVENPQGISIARADDKGQIDYHDRTWFKDAMNGKGISRETLISRSVSRPAVTLATTIRDGDKIVGVATVGIELTSVLEDARAARLGSTGYALVVDEKGRTLAHPDSKYCSTLKDISSFAPVSFALHGHRGAVPFTDEKGDQWLAYAIPVGNGWSAVSLQKEAEVLAEATLVQHIAVAIALCTILLVTLLMSLVAGRVLLPIRHLTEAAKGLASGHWNSRVPENRTDEFGLLAKTFNTMASQLEQGYRHIEDEVGRRTAELIRNNEALRAARHDAECANRAKDQFLANMSHEIRTPMTAIIGYADILESDASAEHRSDALQVIRRNGQTLLKLINDILEITNIEATGITAAKIDCNLAAWTEEFMSLMRPKALEKKLNLQATFDGPIPNTIHTDPFRLRQILGNLVSNAIKFTSAGDIELRICCKPTDDASTNIVSFEVVDPGIGMTSEHINRLFKPFSQADESMTRKFGGGGLGLSISKRLAHILGGDLTVDSKVGAGSKFRLTIDGGPINHSKKADGINMIATSTPPQTSVPPALHARILFAEDGPDNQRLVSLFLRKAGAEVVIADNGKIALDLAQSQSFDLILMDMQMPELDGYAATTELRRTGCKLPIIALTAHAMADDRAKCINAGCDDYLTKPIDRKTLITNLAGHLAVKPTIPPTGLAA